VIGDAVILLQQSYRFGPESNIGQLAHAVQRGDATAAMQVCQATRGDDLVWLDIQSPAECHERLAQRLRVGFQPYLERVTAGAPPADVFEAFDHFRILCAHRSGPLGTIALNQHIEALLQTAKLLDARATWYPGRPVMVTRNDYQLRLFNGDVGITLPDPEANGQLRVYFPTADGGMRPMPPFRVPEHETVFAMTVHKSQGSEFEDVVLVLGDEHSPVMTRELLYTGITRARARLGICGGEEALKAAVGRQLQRSSGLREALWEHA
jgi:exodeoxyribonuclease V alpha subunit